MSTSENLNKNLSRFGVLYVTPDGLQFINEEFAQAYCRKYGKTFVKKVKKRTKRKTSKTLKNGTK